MFSLTYINCRGGLLMRQLYLSLSANSKVNLHILGLTGIDNAPIIDVLTFNSTPCEVRLALAKPLN